MKSPSGKGVKELRKFLLGLAAGVFLTFSAVPSAAWAQENQNQRETGWHYDEDREKWYYYTEEGNLQTGWFQDSSGSWYWFNSRGEMVCGGYQVIDGQRYYFLENGQMAAGQYAGLSYMNLSGQPDSSRDMTVEGRGNAKAVNAETRKEITKALQDIPREWILHFLNHGWEFVYYPDKEYFSAPQSDGEIYYVRYKLDDSCRKIKFCDPEALTQAFGEYIGYASGCYEPDSQFMEDLLKDSQSWKETADIPEYFVNDAQFTLGRLISLYLTDPEARETFDTKSLAGQMIRTLLQCQPGTLVP